LNANFVQSSQKEQILTKKPKLGKKTSGRGLFPSAYFAFCAEKHARRCTLFRPFKGVRYGLESAAKKESAYYKNDCCNNDSQQVEACIATTVAALACKYVYKQEDLTDYGNGIQNAAPEVAPRRERSVSLGQKHIGCFVIDSLFHVFSPFLRFAPKYYTYSIPLFSFFGKSFFNSVFVTLL
jgi:hypothetical protein